MSCCRRNSNDKNLEKHSYDDQNEKNMEKNVQNNPNYYDAKCQNLGKQELNNNGIENSTRFSIRVMEAMRSLQRNNNDKSLPSSNIKDIAEYIKANYNFDGDLDAQVQTVLSRIWRQGVHNFLTSQSSCKRKYKSRSESRCSKKRKKEKKSKKKRKNKECIKIISDHSEPKEENLTENNISSKSQKKHFSIDRSRSSLRKEAQASSKNQSKHRLKKLKSSQKRNRSAEKSECGCGRTHNNNEIDEDFQSANSPNTFVTCQELNTGRLIAQNKILNSVSNLNNKFYNSSPEMDENSTNSEEENSSDSVYQELKSKKIKHHSSNNKDLKKWIKHCRQKCPRN
ncbi:putative uncharacterized protein DDB_G0286901 isoform X2 [Leptopilina boulardi]|uniref:putative uncharacterized protein DDB_G0286901 isoform X2 n=1 Tax=Leptopilina boulardi TaxID=63433 RepID=UPI0021F5BEB5|nr:putative uncharacterized protein DDB_G0286901 isoform X2 [Leptopilina boulardi]